MKSKQVTVILPVHEITDQVEKWFPLSIQSINEQKELPSSVLVVCPKEISSKLEKLLTNENNSNIKNILKFLINDTGNYGFCDQINFGVSNCDTEYFSYLEYDDEYSKIWFKNVNRYISAYPEVDVFLPLIVETDPLGNFMSFTNEPVWAKDFSEELGMVDNSILQNFANFNIAGMVVKKDKFVSLGQLKQNVKLTFMYEFLLRLSHYDSKIMVIPKMGYRHTNQREGSLFVEYQSSMSQDEAKFWFNSAKKEYYFKENDRKITYDAI